jgi:DNA adenine methylase
MHSPVCWLGGKSRIASQIIEAFPLASSYDVFCEPFVGSASILFAKPRGNHLEVINDLNSRLITFWMAVRDDVERLQWKLQTLPYSEALFKQYRQNLNNHEILEMVEEAAQWYYINRCTIAGHINSQKGFSYTAPKGKIKYAVPSEAVSYHNAVALLSVITGRLREVQIHAWDFEKIIKKYQTSRTLFYVDSPYIGSEPYYEVDGTPLFTQDDHVRLAELLNKISAQVAISHYDHSWLHELYPASKWRKLIWQTNKESSRMNRELQVTQEVLLCNYPAIDPGLWEYVGE